MSEFLERPQHDLASRDDHVLDGPDPATAGSAHAAAWGAAPDGESALLGPTLGDPGRGLDLGNLAIDTLERSFGGLPKEPHLALAQLDDLAGKQLADVDQQADVFGLGTGTAPIVAQNAPAVLPKVGGPTKPPLDRAAMIAQIDAAGTKELSELDAGLNRQLADLDRSFTAEQKQLDGAVNAQESTTAAAAAAGASSLGADIAAKDRANHQQIAVESTRNVREVAKQRAALGNTADSERGWHAATRDQILADDVNPHVAQHTATAQGQGAPLANAATAMGGIKARQAGSNAKRAAQAASTGNLHAGAILMQAFIASHKIAADGEQLVADQHARTEAAQKDITSEEATQGARIQTQSNIANNEMAAHASAGMVRMEVERAGFNAQTSGATAGASSAMAAESTAGKTRADALKAETAGKIRATHATARAKVEAKVAKLRADLATTADVDLARRRRSIGKELASLDGTDQTANAAMKRQGKQAASTLSSENDARIQRIRAEGAKARAAISTFVQSARKRILAADKSTDRDIAGAAKRGREAIQAVGADASKQLVQFSETRQVADVAAASKDLAAYDLQAATATTQLANLANGVGAAIDKQWLDDALTTSSKALEGENFFGPTDAEATAGMRVLTSLPPHLQGDAIAKLSPDQFDNLLSEVPAGNREELDALVKNTTDPERKLQLWRIYHKAHVTADVARDKPGADAESQRRHDARDAAAKTTHGEVDDEIAFMHQQVAATGTPLSIAAVDDLIARKDTEHAMEMKYNVNFTNEGGARVGHPTRPTHAAGTHIHWTNDELKMLDNTLTQLPDAHLAGNANLKQMKRTEQIPWDNKPTWLAGSSGGGDILIGDQGAGLSGKNMRHAGDQREMVDPALMARSNTISPLEMTVTHELGHDMQAVHAAAYGEYQTAMGWQSHTAAGSGLNAAQLTQLEAGRSNHYGSRNYVTDSNKDFRVDPNGAAGSYRSTHAGAIPAKGEHAIGASGELDTWGYARTNDNEMFAEHYAKAVQVPEMLHKDLVTLPDDAVKAANANIEQLEKLRAAAIHNPAQVLAIDSQLTTARATLASTEQAKRLRKQEFDIMRDKVFNTDEAQLAAEARLQAKGLSATKLDEFKKAAAAASTPAQLATIEALY